MLREIAEYHGYKQTRGKGAGEQGSVFALQLAIVNHEVATVQIDHEELRPLITWLREQASAQGGTVLGETIASLADQLAVALPVTEEGAVPSLLSDSPINTFFD